MTSTATSQTLRTAVRDRRHAAGFFAGIVTDQDLARMVRDALRALARHSEHYARRLESCPGVRLSGQIVTGYAAPTASGRAVMTAAYVKAYAALVIPPGLDGNEFIDVLTDRVNPRIAHLDPHPITSETDADREDRAGN